MNVSDISAEIMKQNFDDSKGINYTKYALILFLKKNNFCLKKVHLSDFARFVYHFYSDNPNYALQNSNVYIQNILKFDVSDILDYVRNEIINWISFGNGYLQFQNDFINTSSIAIEQKDVDLLSKIIKMVSLKKLNEYIEYDDVINYQFDFPNSFFQYKTFMDSTKFKNRALEDVKYCMCCDECNINDLNVVHIDRKNYLNDSNNSLVLCQKHAELFYYNYFSFDKTGRIVVHKENENLDQRMHLSRKILIMRKKFFV